MASNKKTHTGYFLNGGYLQIWVIIKCFFEYFVKLNIKEDFFNFQKTKSVKVYEKIDKGLFFSIPLKNLRQFPQVQL